MTFMIDDKFAVASSKAQAKFQAWTELHLLTGLGFFISPDKGVILPSQTGRFLGLMVHTDIASFSIPQDRAGNFVDLVHSLLAQPVISARQLAQLAGKIISFKPAIPLAPLYTRALFQAMVGITPWDDIFPTPTHVRQELLWWKANFEQFNGHSILSATPTLNERAMKEKHGLEKRCDEGEILKGNVQSN